MSDPMYAAVEDSYDNMSQAYFDDTDEASIFPNQICDFADSLQPKSSILNIGGTLGECRYFVERGFEVTDVDISKSMLDHITTVLPKVKTMHGNVADIELPNVDAIWACRSLIHVVPADIDMVLRRLHASLNPGAMFGAIIFIIDKSELGEERIPEWQTNKPGTTYYRVLYPAQTFVSKVKAAGFKLITNAPCVDNDGDPAYYIRAARV